MSKNVKPTKAKWIDPDEAPAWSRDAFQRAALHRGGELLRPAEGTLTKRGRPKLENPKRQVTLRLDGEVIDRLKAAGPGWQSRANEILRKAVKA
jgi:uncharacterized protein (DUF4415 family)